MCLYFKMMSLIWGSGGPQGSLSSTIPYLPRYARFLHITHALHRAEYSQQMLDMLAGVPILLFMYTQ